MCNACLIHNHTEYSLRDSTARPLDAAKKAKSVGYRSYAISDHGNMSGAMEHYKACCDENIKPIMGIEAYYCPDRTVKERGYCHLLLLAKNIRGYKSLLKASSESYTTGFYYKPRFDLDIIKNILSKGDIIATSACVGGIINKKFLNSNYQDTASGLENARIFKEIFGKDFYVELQMHDNQQDMFQRCNDYSLDVAQQLDLPTVFTNDVHFVNKEDMELHKIWKAIEQNRQVNNVSYVYDQSFYIKNEEELRAIAPNQYCVDSTQLIDDQIDWIDLNIDTKNKVRLSKLPSYDNMGKREADQLMLDVIIQEMKDRDLPKEYVVRAKEELDLMLEHNFGSYFLPLWDALRFANEACIPTGPGRGSAAGSLSANMMGITKIDPLKYDLKFSRFLNPGRVFKRKLWTVKDDDGNEQQIVEGFPYHVRNDEGGWDTKKGEELINEFRNR